MSEHRASERGGWGIRLHGSKLFPHPDGSELFSYSFGDVLAYDSEKEAEAAARPIRQSSSYSRVTVERVVKGQRQASHIEAQHAIELRRARAEALEEAATVAETMAKRSSECAEKDRADGWPEHAKGHHFQADAGRGIAQAIRALKESKP